MAAADHGYVYEKKRAEGQNWNPGPFIDTGWNPEDEAYYALPHQCDSWKIGNEEDVRALIADLERLILDYPLTPLNPEHE